MAVEVGQKAPDFTLKDTANRDVSLSDFRGRNVVLVFYPLAFSSVCTTQLTGMGANEARYASEDCQVVGVSVDSRHANRAFAESLGLKDTILLADFEPKGAVARTYGVYRDAAGFANRASFVIDREGVVRSAVVNEPPDLPDEDAYFATLAACNAG
jgi:mycoredoxin-dependent peroxiredoxin